MSGEDSLERRILNWLEKQGYPLEMDTAATFRRHGFSAVLSYFYENPERERPREIDVYAWSQFSAEDVDVRLVILVECKLSNENPWVTFSESQSGPVEGTDLSFMALSPKLYPFFLRHLSKRRPELASTTVFGRVDRVAYGARTAFSGADLAFQAVSSAVSAATAMLKRSIEDLKADDHPTIELIVPVVVFDNVLMDYVLQQDGTRTLEVREAMTLVTPVAGHSRNVLVHLVSAAGLDRWVSDVKAAFDTIQKDCSAELQLVKTRWNTASVRKM